MKKTFVTIPMLTDLNSYIKAERGNRYAASKIKKKDTEAVRWAIRGANPPWFERVYLTIDYYMPNKRKDKDNIAFMKKFILDGLVDEGVIDNDGWKQISGWKERFYIDEENPRIEVFIIESKD